MRRQHYEVVEPTILSSFLLSGCAFDPVFDVSSWEAYERSSANVKSKLTNDDLRRLNIALDYLSADGFPKTVADAQQPSSALARVSLDTILLRLRSRIEGRNAATVIADLTTRPNAEISSAETRLHSAANIVDAVEIESPSYSWTSSGYYNHAVIDFAVRNAGNVPISRAFLDFALVTPNRSIPWARYQYVQSFKGGLEPRERRNISIPAAGQWSDPQLKDLVKAELKVTVVNFTDANGIQMIPVDRERLNEERKVLALLH